MYPFALCRSPEGKGKADGKFLERITVKTFDPCKSATHFRCSRTPSDVAEIYCGCEPNGVAGAASAFSFSNLFDGPSS